MSEDDAATVDGGHEASDRTLERDAVTVSWPGLYLRGVAMGAADAVPGVSGGTIALITGIYDRLVGAIASLDPTALRGPLVDPETSRVRESVAALVRMDVPFLLVLGLGVGTGVAAFSQVLEYALSELTLLTFGFFFGLIAASAVVLYREVYLDSTFQKLVATGGIVVGFTLVSELQAALGHELPVVFAAGVVAISAMLLPGVSGSFLLLVLGQLEFMSETLNEFLEKLANLLSGGRVSQVVEPGIVVVTFLAGAAIGVLSIARIVDYALDRNRAATLTFLVSLMVGALWLPTRRVLVAGNGEPGQYGLAVVAAVVGAALILGLDRVTGGIGFE